VEFTDVFVTEWLQFAEGLVDKVDLPRGQEDHAYFGFLVEFFQFFDGLVLVHFCKGGFYVVDLLLHRVVYTCVLFDQVFEDREWNTEILGVWGWECWCSLLVDIFHINCTICWMGSYFWFFSASTISFVIGQTINRFHCCYFIIVTFGIYFILLIFSFFTCFTCFTKFVTIIRQLWKNRPSLWYDIRFSNRQI